MPNREIYDRFSSISCSPTHINKLYQELAASKAEVELGNQLIAKLDRERRNNEAEVEEWVYRHSEMEAACSDWMQKAEKAEAEVEMLKTEYNECVDVRDSWCDEYTAEREARQKAEAELAELWSCFDKQMQAEAEVERLKEQYESAAELVARMHEAAVGEIRGPIISVIEDIKAVRERAVKAEAKVERIRAEKNACLEGNKYYGDKAVVLQDKINRAIDVLMEKIQ